MLTEKQKRLLLFIDKYYRELDEFPTYKTIGEELGVTKQRVEQHIKHIEKKMLNPKKPVFNFNYPKVIGFLKLLKQVQKGWVSYTVYLDNGVVENEKVTSSWGQALTKNALKNIGRELWEQYQKNSGQ